MIELLGLFLTSASASLSASAVLALRVHESVICVLRISLPLLLLLVSLPLAQLLEFVFHLAPEVLCRRYCHGVRLLLLLNELLVLHHLIELIKAVVLQRICCHASDLTYVVGIKAGHSSLCCRRFLLVELLFDCSDQLTFFLDL